MEELIKTNKNINYDKIYKKVHKKIYDEHFKEQIKQETRLIYPNNYNKLFSYGIDKIVLKVKKGFKDNLWKGKKENIKGKYFSKFVIGEFNNSFYCHIYIDLSEIFYKNTVFKIKNSNDINKILKNAIEELEQYGYIIDYSQFVIKNITISKTIPFRQNYFDEKTVNILLDEVLKLNFVRDSCISKKNIKVDSFYFKNNDLKVTFKNNTKKILKYDILNTNENKKVTSKEIDEIGKKYYTFWDLKMECNDTNLVKIIDENKLNIDYLLSNIDDFFYKIFYSNIEKIGLTINQFDKINTKKIKKLKPLFINEIKNSQRRFIANFIYRYMDFYWGIEQLFSIIDEIGGNKDVIKARKRSIKSNLLRPYKVTNVYGTEIVDSFDRLVKIINKISD